MLIKMKIGKHSLGVGSLKTHDSFELNFPFLLHIIYVCTNGAG